MAGGDVVEHRVQASVEDDQRHGDPPGVVDHVGRRAALDHAHASEQVQQVNHVVGQEAEERDGQDGVDDPHRLLGRFGLYLGDPPGSQRVAQQDDQGGQQRAKGEAQNAVGRQAGVPLGFGEVLKAAAASGFLLAGGQRTHEDEDQHGHGNGEPERRAHHHGAPGAPKLQVEVRVNGGHVAVHADAGHEADAQVDVGEEEDAGDAAGHVAKHPVVAVDVVVDPEGQRAQDDDVGQSQVADVHAEGGAMGGSEGEDHERRQVPRQPQN